MTASKEVPIQAYVNWIAAGAMLQIHRASVQSVGVNTLLGRLHQTFICLVVLMAYPPSWASSSSVVLTEMKALTVDD